LVYGVHPRLAGDRQDRDSAHFPLETVLKIFAASLANILDSLNNTPLAMQGTDTRGPDIITTYSNAMRLIKESLYNPLKYFPF
jgi:hypothetical protein